jgi:hypothetical protein
MSETKIRGCLNKKVSLEQGVLFWCRKHKKEVLAHQPSNSKLFVLEQAKVCLLAVLIIIRDAACRFEWESPPLLFQNER